MDNFHVPAQNTRIGFHYFPDALHYRENDLNAWLPEFRALGVSWLTMVAPTDIAIPERFIRGLVQNNIEPVLHFTLRPDALTSAADFRLLFSTYARWGAHYAVIFDRPNTRQAWGTAAWAQTSLVERFLDLYLPLAEAALNAGLTPVFPPLEPGGDYWDTAFLRAALQGILRRGTSHLIESMALSAYGWYSDRPLSWGAGGPERWPAARPYFTPAGTQDQRGFHIFDWYKTIFQAATGRTCPVLMLKVGSGPEPIRPAGDRGSTNRPPAFDANSHAQACLSIAQQMAAPEDGGVDRVPAEVLTSNFWLLTAPTDHPAAPMAWFQNDGSLLPAAAALRQWAAARNSGSARQAASMPNAAAEPGMGAPVSATPAASATPQTPGISSAPAAAASAKRAGVRPIAHYLLLPVYEWGVADWHLDVIQSFVKKHRPTVGFSVDEARLADMVTVVGGDVSFPAAVIAQLRAEGCKVVQISGDGTSIATKLATL